MPELPEVETVARDLRSRILDKKIKQVKVSLPRIVKTRNFKKSIEGNKFMAIDRVGKLIVITLKHGGYLLVHLKMTGQLVYRKGGRIIAGGHSGEKDVLCLPCRHTRATFVFDDNSELYFNDMRTFGYLKIVDEAGLGQARQSYGLEPFGPDFKFANFKKLVQKRQTSIKAVLLNQLLIAGLGNIYADEVLFRAGVRPDRTAASLEEEELKKIFRSIRPVLKKAIDNRGTTFNNFVDADGQSGGFLKHLNVYGRAGKKCRKCGSIIKKAKVAGRGTHWCGECQG